MLITWLAYTVATKKKSAWLYKWLSIRNLGANPSAGGIPAALRNKYTIPKVKAGFVRFKVLNLGNQVKNSLNVISWPGFLCTLKIIVHIPKAHTK